MTSSYFLFIDHVSPQYNTHKVVWPVSLLPDQYVSLTNNTLRAHEANNDQSEGPSLHLSHPRLIRGGLTSQPSTANQRGPNISATHGQSEGASHLSHSRPIRGGLTSQPHTANQRGPHISATHGQSEGASHLSHPWPIRGGVTSQPPMANHRILHRRGKCLSGKGTTSPPKQSLDTRQS